MISYDDNDDQQTMNLKVAADVVMCVIYAS